MLELFLEPPPTKVPVAKAIEECLYHDCMNDYSKTKDFILGKEEYLKSMDQDGRTVLS